MIVQVSPSLNIFAPLSYNYEGDMALLKPGVRVVIPLGNRIITGWVTDTHSDYMGRVKNIIAIIRDEYLPDNQYMAFVKAVSGIYFTSMGTLLDSALPPMKKPITNLYFQNNEDEGKIEKLNKYSLQELQYLSKSNAIECFYKSRTKLYSPSEIYRQELNSGFDEPVENKFLISYQREGYYCKIIKECISRNLSVLITVPDNLTAAYLREKLGRVDLYNSEIKPKERENLWYEYALGRKIGVVVGGLSSALLPIKNLGTVISERAGSSLYNRSRFSIYNILLLSQLRAKHFNIPLVKGFSTYTVQSYRNRSQVSIEDNREKNIPIEVRMIKSRSKGIPEDFIELLNCYFLENKKILIVLNKKKNSNFLFCAKCKKFHKCPSCGGFIEVDDKFNIKCLRCRLENESYTICPQCKEDLSIVEDISIASVRKIIEKKVMETGIMTLSSEGLKKEHIYSILSKIKNSKIVISTPIILNPFFNKIFDAVIYVRPESYFNIDEYDAAEKIFSTAAELREVVKSGGVIDIFSIFHFHYSLKLINDEETFFERELKYREWFHLPPFSNVYHIEVKERELRSLGKEMRTTYKKFKESLNIKRVYLTGRQALRGMYKGILEAHTHPETILVSGLLKKRNIIINLLMI